MVRSALARATRGGEPAVEPASIPVTPVERYDAARDVGERAGICNAPWTNLYFSATGEVGPCWLQLGGLDRWSPERSIRDIWHGTALEEMRAALARDEFPGRCGRCGNDIEEGVRPLAATYDNEHAIVEWPTTLELELSNLCNFECVMCNGDLSSKIRRNRDRLPPLHVPYDDSFVEQVAELIPTLQQVRFSGGEPLMHPILYQICDRIIELRPDLRIDVSTNGSTLNDKVRRLLDRAPVLINISFESLVPERYERIRIGSDHAVLLANIEEFRQLVIPRGGLVTINTNPMRDTWSEMAAIVRFCDERDIHLSLNTVVQPAEVSLRTLPAAELEAVLAALEAEVFTPASSPATRWNRDQFANLIRQVRTWAGEATHGGVSVGWPASSTRS